MGLLKETELKLNMDSQVKVCMWIPFALELKTSLKENILVITMNKHLNMLFYYTRNWKVKYTKTYQFELNFMLEALANVVYVYILRFSLVSNYFVVQSLNISKHDFP